MARLYSWHSFCWTRGDTAETIRRPMMVGHTSCFRFCSLDAIRDIDLLGDCSELQQLHAVVYNTRSNLPAWNRCLDCMFKAYGQEVAPVTVAQA